METGADLIRIDPQSFEELTACRLQNVQWRT